MPKGCSTCAFKHVDYTAPICAGCVQNGGSSVNWTPRDGRKPAEFDEERIDVISQNGNDGLHYDALTSQVGGDHYKNLKIQPAVFIEKNGLSFLEGCVVKRICRWKDKNGLEDLEKAKHEIDLLIQIHGVA